MRQVPETCQVVLAVVKANAYGHGLLRVLPALTDPDGLALLAPAVAAQEEPGELFE